jgi:single-strand DNA-binding protein
MAPARGGLAIERKAVMAGSVNKVILIGNLGKDPEVRFTPGGQAVANFSIATHENWNDKNGQRQERTEWHRIVVWGKQAEHCGEYLKKGRQCYVEGRLQTREWTDKEGKKNYTTEVVANSVVFLGGGRDAGAGPGAGESMGSRRGSGSSGSRGAEDYGGSPPPGMDDSGMNQGGGNGDDDIPF